MELRPIFSALAHHKTGTILVALQIAVSLAIIVNAMFIISARIEKINRPTGMDTDNTILISLRGVGENYEALPNIRRDLDMIRNLPDVVDASITNHFPLTGSGSGTGLRAVPDENVTPTGCGRLNMDEHGLNSLGVNLVRGRDFYPEEVEVVIPGEDEPQTPPVVIITQELADKLFPDDDALGKTVYWGSLEPSTVVGIIDHMQGFWVSWDGLNRNVIHPRIYASNSVRYLVRAKPGTRDRLVPVLEQRLGELNRNRVIRYVRPHTDEIKQSYEVDRLMANILLIVIGLLIGLTALVIVGLASYFVSQRTRQIGTRRALGATRFDILRYFLVENWLITTMGAIVGCILTVAIGYWLETSFELPRLDWRYLAASIVVLWVVSQFAAYWPARKATLVAPAIATRTV